jgi:hypothetical protein
MSFSKEYRAVTRSALDGIAGLSAEIYQFGLEHIIRNWQMNHHAIQRATVPLTQFALSRMAGLKETPFIKKLRHYYEEKVTEETGHDEVLVRDLEKMGCSREDIAKFIPATATTALIGTQYYLIQHHHPVALLSYFGLLEFPFGVPPDEQVKALIAESGVPAEAFENYYLHVTSDEGHYPETLAMLDEVPEEEPLLRRLVLTNGIRTGEFICQIMETVLEAAASERDDDQVSTTESREASLTQ